MRKRSRPWLGRILPTILIGLLLWAVSAGAQPASEEETLRLGAELYGLRTELVARLRAEDSNAVPLAERILGISSRLLQSEHPDIAIDVLHLGIAYRQAGEITQARIHLERAAELAEKAYGPSHSTTASILAHLGRLQHQIGELGEARLTLQRALLIQEQAGTPASLALVLALGDLGNLLHEIGEVASARQLLERALAIVEKLPGSPESIEAKVLNDLSMVLLTERDLDNAHILMERAIALSAQSFGMESPRLARYVNHLCMIEREKGDFWAALRLCQQALGILEKKLPPNHPDTAAALVNLGTVLTDLKIYPAAEALLVRARDIEVQVYGADHPQGACTLGALGNAAKLRGEDELARAYFKQTLDIRRAQKGLDPLGLGIALNNQACALVPQDPERAISALEEAKDISGLNLPSHHPSQVGFLINLASTCEGAGQLQDAIELTTRALELEEKTLYDRVGFESPEGMSSLLEYLNWNSAWALSLLLTSAKASPETIRLGLTTVLRRKGRDIELRARPGAALADPEADELLKALRRTREEWAFLRLRDSKVAEKERIKKLCLLSDRIQLLSSELQRVYQRLGQSPPKIDIESVQQRIPEGTALIEIFQFTPIELDSTIIRETARGSRYAAFVLHNHGEPIWEDLGDAATIDTLVEAFRASLEQADPHVKKYGQQLDRVTMARLRPLLGSVQKLLLSPDGTLNLVPFAALVDEEGSYLVERYSLSYLTSGRDLLRGEPVSSREPPLVLGAPTSVLNFAHLEGLDNITFSPIPGSAEEAKVIGAELELGPDRILIGEAASEQAVKAVRGPKILHIATHGFFLGNAVRELGEDVISCLDTELDLTPLVRSGLILREVEPSGATAAEDGILTAAEALDLDLTGTEIVILSACETGVGETRPGHGVYGLRRALSLAGARTQLTSLWRVPDKATTELMTSWYAQLKKGIPRGTAWRAIQLAALQGNSLPLAEAPLSRGAVRIVGRDHVESRHPYFWASFILVGDTGPLQMAD